MKIASKRLIRKRINNVPYLAEYKGEDDDDWEDYRDF